MLSRSAKTGDWVVAIKPINIGLTGRIPVRTRGVVTATSGWNSLEIQFDSGIFGLITARGVRAGQVQVIRRGGGTEHFRESAERLRYARIGVAVALFAPLIAFCIRDIASGDSKAGLLAKIIDGIVSGGTDFVSYGLGHPIGAAIYLIVLAGANRFIRR